MANDAGPLLARAGLIAEAQLTAAREAQQRRGGTLGEHLVLLGAIDDDELCAFYRARLMVPRVDPARLQNIPKRIIERIPRDMAAEFRVVPVSVDKEQNLVLAMSDPSDTHAVDEIAFFTDAYVVRAVATQREIATALARYYDVTTPIIEAELAAATTPPAASERRRVRPPITSPPPGDGRAARLSDIVPAIREARHPERSAMPSSEHGAAPPPAQAAPDAPAAVERAAPHARPTLQEATGPDAPDDDTEPGRSANNGPPKRRSDEPPRTAAGEVDATLPSDAPASQRLPAVVVDDDAQEPVLLDRPKAPTAPPAAAGEAQDAGEAHANDDVVLLEQPKRKRRRSSQTRLGLGDFGPQRLPMVRSLDKAGSARVGAPDPARSPSTTIETPQEPADAADAAAAASERVPTAIGDPITTGRYQREHFASALDDGWDEPSSASPPANLGTSNREAAPSSRPGISAPDFDSLDAADRRLSYALAQLQAARTRDEVIDTLIAFLGGTCRRVAFFAVTKGALRSWVGAGESAASHDLDRAALSLERPSSLQNIVATCMPFHGPLHDAVSRNFLLSAVGAAPSDVTALPVAVRGRVAGILYGDERLQPLPDEHLAALARAAGEALERVLLERKNG